MLCGHGVLFGADIELLSLAYQRDAAGRITRVTSDTAAESWIYTHDDLDRLTNANNLGDNTLDQTFAYDTNGNMTSNSKLGTYSYPAPSAAHPHAPNTAGPRSYTYDANGNVASDPRIYVWDGENRMLSVAAVAFAYWPDGARMKKTSSGTTTYFGADFELSPSGAWTKYLTPEAVRIGSSTTWLIRDHLGSVRMRTTSAGAELERAPYGAQAPALTIAKGYITHQRADRFGKLRLLLPRMLPRASLMRLSAVAKN